MREINSHSGQVSTKRMPGRTALSGARYHKQAAYDKGFWTTAGYFLPVDQCMVKTLQNCYLPFWMLAASTSFKAQIATFFGVDGNFKSEMSSD